MELWNYRGKQDTVTKALQLNLPEHAVISVTGAGGKTSLIFIWARELAESGMRVAITTTTKMAHPDIVKEYQPGLIDGIPVVLTPCTQMIDNALDDMNIVLAAASVPDFPSKISAPHQDILQHIISSADIVLIEADGAKRMSFKWPAPWEPVIVPETNITVCVAGLSALGGRLSDVMFRTEFLPEALRRDIVDETLMCAVLSDTEGGQKSALGEYRVFLNQADDEILSASASRMQQILAVRGIQSAWGSLKIKAGESE